MIELTEEERTQGDAVCFQLIRVILAHRLREPVAVYAIARIAGSILGPKTPHDLRVLWETELGRAAAIDLVVDAARWQT